MHHVDRPIEHVGDRDGALRRILVRRRHVHAAVVFDDGRLAERMDRLQLRRREARRGVGLGLSIVRQMVDAMGLGLAVRSTPGRGTVFTVVLPLAGED